MTENNTNELTFEFTEKTLLESLHNIHDSARLAKEIQSEQKKLDTLISIKTKFNDDSQPNSSTMDSLLLGITELEAKIKHLESEMNGAEQRVVKGFEDILLKLHSASEKTIDRHSSQIRQELHRSVNESVQTIRTSIKSTDEKIAQVESQKLDVSAERDLYKAIDVVKSKIIAVQEEDVKRLEDEQNNRLKDLQTRVDGQLRKFSYENIFQNIQQKTLSNMNEQLKEFVRTAKEENINILEKHKQQQTDKLKNYVEQAVLSHVDSTQLQTIITSLPEFKRLQQLATELKSTENQVPDLRQSPQFKTLKETMDRMSYEMAQLKQVTDTTRSIVATLKEHGVPEPSDRANFDLAASVKHIEDINRDITVMYNSIKMMEAVMQINGLARKRKRTDEPTYSEDGEEYADEEIAARVAKIEERQEMLQDFIYQYQTTILDEKYPNRINASMQKINQVLRNHEQFIAFLVDPFKATPRVVTLPEESETLSDAMLDAIQTLVRQTAEEMAMPLHNKIKALEEKLL